MCVLHLLWNVQNMCYLHFRLKTKSLLPSHVVRSRMHFVVAKIVGKFALDFLCSCLGALCECEAFQNIPDHFTTNALWIRIWMREMQMARCMPVANADKCAIAIAVASSRHHNADAVCGCCRRYRLYPYFFVTLFSSAYLHHPAIHSGDVLLFDFVTDPSRTPHTLHTSSSSSTASHTPSAYFLPRRSAQTATAAAVSQPASGVRGIISYYIDVAWRKNTPKILYRMDARRKNALVLFC